MKHLDDETAIRLAETGLGEAGPAGDHVAQCRRCRDLVEQYQRLFGVVESAQALDEEPPAWMKRWASAFAHSAATPRRRWLMLPLLAQTTGAVAAVRGTAAGTAYLYGDESHHLDLRIEPSEQGRSCLHGQLLQVGCDQITPWRVTVVKPNGEAIRTFTNETGEFWLEGVDSFKQVTVIASSETERLVARLGEEEPAAAE